MCLLHKQTVASFIPMAGPIVLMDTAIQMSMEPATESNEVIAHAQGLAGTWGSAQERSQEQGWK